MEKSKIKRIKIILYFIGDRDTFCLASEQRIFQTLLKCDKYISKCNMELYSEMILVAYIIDQKSKTEKYSFPIYGIGLFQLKATHSFSSSHRCVTA